MAHQPNVYYTYTIGIGHNNRDAKFISRLIRPNMVSNPKCLILLFLCIV